MTTKIYIDVDGVINSFHKSEKAGWEGDWKLAKIIGYKIHWYTSLVEELNKLSKREDVQMVWLTTWQHQAVTELCPVLGIEGTDWQVLTCDDEKDLFDLRNGWWKLRAIKKDVEEHNPEKIVWIDDDLKYEMNACEWVHTMGNVHAVSPFTDWGMTKEDFDGIIEFISAS